VKLRELGWRGNESGNKRERIKHIKIVDENPKNFVVFHSYLKMASAAFYYCVASLAKTPHTV
jgi:hypothetical protein